MSKPTASESQIQASIMQWLAAKRILAFRQNTGTLKVGTRYVTFGVPGMADILAFPQEMAYPDLIWRPTVLWIECKAPKGKQSDLQKSFQQQMEDQGHRYIVAKSIDDVAAAL